MQLRWMWSAALIAAAAIGVSSCGGGSEPVPANTPPDAVIAFPTEGSTFRASDPIRIEVSANDAQDGALPATSLTWWVDLHHDTHTHPLVLPTTGMGGSTTLPPRIETSDNIWLRVHLRATDSTGASTEVSRDVLPQKVQIALRSQPAGLQLTLDGQPVTAPFSFTGVVAVERDLGAADQVSNGRSYRFSGWSDGGAAMHTIATPATNTTYTAVFIDAGPAVNAAPTVTMTAPANNSSGNVGSSITLSATASDTDGTVARVQFFDGDRAIGAADTTAPFSVTWRPATEGVHTLTARATDDLGATATSTAVRVTINASGSDAQPPTVTIVEPVDLADNLTGNIAFAANASDNVGVASVEFQVDGVTVATDTSAPYSTTVDTSLHAAGQHVLRVRARDGAGNVSDWTRVLVRFGGTREAPAGITRTLNWVTGIRSGTALAELPDGRILVAQQEGQLRVVMADGTLLQTPLLTVPVDFTGERGLLGVAVHPQFSTNGFVYIYHTTREGGTHNRISRFTVTGNTAGGEVVLADLPTLSAGIHNGGAMHFGADGKLYVAVGDNQVSANSQNLNSPLGKLLRFNDDGSIPSDNPYCTTPGNLACAGWAHGLRNPFTFAVQPGTGRIHVNDVGQGLWEEINVISRGANYGWPATEGLTNASGITPPMFVYPHERNAPVPPGNGPGGFFVGACIVGGAFYPASGPFPAPWRGGYFFADFVASFVGFIDLNNGNAAYSFGSVTQPSIGAMVTRNGSLLILHRSSITRFAAS